MALNNLGLGLLLTAKDMASSVIDRVKQSFEKLGGGSEEASARFGEALATFGKGAATFGIGVSAVTGMYGLAEAAAPFETSMAMVGYRTQASAEEMAALRKSALDASASLKIVSETEAAAALEAFARGGNTAADSMKTLNPILAFAKANMMDVRAAATFADEMMDKYGVTADEVAGKLDQAQWVTRRFGLEVGDLNTLFGPMAQMAKGAGQSFDDMLILFGAAAETAGPRGAMIALRGAMMQIANPDFAKKVKENFAGLDVSGPEGQIMSLTEMLPKMAGALEGMNEQQRLYALRAVFGGRAAGGLADIFEKLRTGVKGANGEILTGAAAMQTLIDQMQNSEGEVQKAIGAMSPYDKAMQEASASWANFKRALGEAFLPAFAAAFKAVGDAVRWVVQAFESIPAPIRTFLGTAALVIAGITTLAGLFLMLKGALSLIAIAWGVVAGAETAALWPVLAVVAGIAAVIAIGVLLWKYWDEIGNFFVELWEGWKQLVWDVADNAIKAFNWWYETISDFLSDMLDLFVEVFTVMIPEAFWSGLASIESFFTTIGGAIATFFTEDIPNTLMAGVEAVGDFFLSIGEAIWDFFTNTIPNAVKEAAKSIKKFVLDIPIVGDVLGLAGDAFDWATDKAAGMLDYVGLNVGSPVSVEKGGMFDVMTHGFAVPAGGGVPSPIYQPAVAFAEAQQASWREPVTPAAPPGRPQQQPPINVSVQVDGEEIAKAVARGNRSLLQRVGGEPNEEGEGEGT